MKVLILGSGGREHALAARLSEDADVKEVLVIPGNPGMSSHPKIRALNEPVTFSSVLNLVNEHRVDLTVVGPEKYLFEGIVDFLEEKGVTVFGPTRAAAFLEESKIKSKHFMKKMGIPTAPFVETHTLEEALDAIQTHEDWPGYVLKLSGPALGKGVIVAQNKIEAEVAAKQFFQFKPPGFDEGVLIEKKIFGREVSLFYVCSGDQYQFLASACDHKRLLDRDEGPNTGGMGAYSPCHWINEKLLKDVEKEVVQKTLAGMISNGSPFKGILFVGLMVTTNGYFVLEYNTRFGDPETQTFLPLLEGNFSKLLYTAAKGTLKSKELTVSIHPEKTAVHVVKAARGYPGIFGNEIETGKQIQFSNAQKSPGFVFFAGVKREGETLVSNGGRVLGATGLGSGIQEARLHAYHLLKTTHFSGEQFRSDIGEVK